MLENNNTIYMGYDMIDSLANPIQLEDNYVRIGLCTKLNDPNHKYAQSITFPNGTSTTIEYNGVIRFISVYRPTRYEVECPKA